MRPDYTSQKVPRVESDPGWRHSDFTSVVFAAVLSAQGGARVLFRLAEIGAIRLMIGPSVLKEVDKVVRRKAPKSMPLLAQLLDAARVEIGQPALARQHEQALAIIEYAPDAAVLAEALRAEPDRLITHDREHFMSEHGLRDLPFKVDTPGGRVKIRSQFRGHHNSHQLAA